MRRWKSAAVVLLVSHSGALRGQEPANAIPYAIIGGWTLLGIGSVARLAERGRHAADGNEVRVTVRTPSGSIQTRGRLSFCGTDSVAVTSGDSSTVFARADIKKMDIYIGAESKWAQGWVTGLLVGGGGLGLLGLLAGGSSQPGCDEFCSPGEVGALLGIFGGFAGSVLGAGIGAVIHGDHWGRVNGLDRSRVSVMPIVGRGNGVAVRVGVGF